MEARMFLKEANRMCKSKRCDECLAAGINCLTNISIDTPNEDIDKLVEIVEDWSKNNPIKTNMTKLGEVFGNCVTEHFECYLRFICTDQEFREEAFRWLGEEYKDVDKE